MTDVPSEVFDAAADPTGSVAAAVDRLRAGEVVVLPTETVYGVAAIATDPVAVEEVFVRKGRPAERLVAVLVADVDQARSVAEVDDRFERLAANLWPGPLTMVAPKAAHVPEIVSAGLDSLAIRIPGRPDT